MSRIRFCQWALMVVCLLIAGCYRVEVASAQVSAIPAITTVNYPRVNGSASTIPIGQLLLCRALGLQGELRRVPPSPYGRNESTLAFVFPL